MHELKVKLPKNISLRRKNKLLKQPKQYRYLGNLEYTFYFTTKLNKNMFITIHCNNGVIGNQL